MPINNAKAMMGSQKKLSSLRRDRFRIAMWTIAMGNSLPCVFFHILTPADH